MRAVGHAVRHGHLLRFDHLTPDGGRPAPHDPDFTPRCASSRTTWCCGPAAGTSSPTARRTVPAGRPGWGVHRLDRVHAHDPTGVPFRRRELPGGDVVRFVTTSHDRGDTPARWQCLGTAVLDLPPDVVARWAPGGSVVEYVTPTCTRITLGAWSWGGIAGLLATFDADVTDVEPAELRTACRTLARRHGRSGQPATGATRAGSGSRDPGS